MSGKKSWSLDVTSSRPHPQVALPTSAAPRPNASTSPTAALPRASPTRHWLLPMSASSSLARARRPLTPSARWTRTSTAAWWDKALRWVWSLVCPYKKMQVVIDLWFLFLVFQWGSSVYLCYKKSLAKANTIAYKAGKVAACVIWAKSNSEFSSNLIVEMSVWFLPVN